MKRYIKSAVDSSNDFEIDENGVLVEYHGNAANVAIPDGVKEIGWGAFSKCTGLTSVTIPDSVTSIGNYAFSFCSGLKSITIPNSVTEIDNGAFKDCTSLKSITISNSVTYVYGETFSGCRSLTSITIPDGVEAIGKYAFKNCTSLENIKIPNSVTIIRDQAFAGCKNLKSISLPENVELKDDVFRNTPLESKFKKYKSKVVEPKEEEFDVDDQIVSDFDRLLESMIREGYDVIDYDVDTSFEDNKGSDFIRITLGDGSKYEFEFDHDDELNRLSTDELEEAAYYYAERIKEGIDSGEALVEE